MLSICVNGIEPKNNVILEYLINSITSLQTGALFNREIVNTLYLMLDFLHTVPLRSDFSSISFLWFHFFLIARTPTKTKNRLHQITGGYSMAWGVPGVQPLCIYSVFWGPPIRKQHYNQHPASRYQSVSNDHYASFVHCFMTPTGYK
jgi:hypothetical protein